VTTVLIILYVVVLPAAVWAAHMIGFTRGERAEFKRIVSGVGGISLGGRAEIKEDGSLDPAGPLRATVVFRRDRH
jgi:hypothetical protein